MNTKTVSVRKIVISIRISVPAQKKSALKTPIVNLIISTPHKIPAHTNTAVMPATANVLIATTVLVNAPVLRPLNVTPLIGIIADMVSF